MSDINEEKMQNVIEQMKEDNIKFIRLQFVDINGTVKNIVIPFNEEDMEELFNEGMLFDGSSIAGFILTLIQDYPGDQRNPLYVDSSVTYGLLNKNHSLETQEAFLKNPLQKSEKWDYNTISVRNQNFSLWTLMKTDIQCHTMKQATSM